MSHRPLCSIVLAAGQGKRMRAPGPKVLVRACGRTLVEHVLEASQPLEAHPTVVVHGHGGDAVRDALSGREVVFAHQASQLGTGHAVQCALRELGEFDGDVLVLCGDTPLLTSEVLTALVADHRSAERALTVLSAELENPRTLGRVLRGENGEMSAIREFADASPEERAVREINTGVLVISSEHLGPGLARLTADNAQGEFYLTDLPRLFLDDGLRVGAFLADDPGAALGVNDRIELAEAVRVLRRRALERAMRAGVVVEDPGTTVLDTGVEIGAGTLLRPCTHIGPDVRVGKDCRIGPFALLSEGVVVGDGTHLGAHVEVRRCNVEAEVRVAGPARLVDAAIGRGAQIGPGVVTTAEEEGRVVIGEQARVGAGAILHAPLTVGECASVAPGSLLLRDEGVPAGGA
jgi:bifunctional UDP-N-acetylglucosamine pyrophosphorylase/glucosamine-1-phosphate N-acetyltransferase